MLDNMRFKYISSELITKPKREKIMPNELQFKYMFVDPTYDIDLDIAWGVIHAINDPVGDSNATLCGLEKSDVPGSARRYCSYVDGLPEVMEICPSCLTVIKRRVGKIYGIEKWERIK